jgi:hypothetical protein
MDARYPPHFLFNEVRMKARSFVTLLIIVAFLMLITPFIVQASTPSQEATPAPVPVPEAVLLLISAGAGGLCVKIVNFLKLKFGWITEADRIKNVWLTFGTSAVMGILLLLITSSFAPITGPETLVTWITLAFTVATLLYKTVSQSSEPTIGNSSIK